MSQHIGTTKIETASGTREVPVFDPADLEEPGWFRVETPSGTGAVRLVDIGDANLDEYRVQTPGGLKGVATLLPGAIPDSGGTHQWDHGEGTGSTLADSIGSLDGAINGATWVSVGQGYFLDYDGGDDYTDLGSGSTSAFTHFTELGTGTWFAIVNPDDVSVGQLFSSTFATSVRGAGFRFNGGQLDAFLGDGNGNTIGRATGGSISTGSRVPLAVTADGSDLMAWVGDPISQVASDSLSNLTAGDWGSTVKIGRRGEESSEFFDGGMGVSFTDASAWSQSELQSFIDSLGDFYQ